VVDDVAIPHPLDNQSGHHASQTKLIDSGFEPVTALWLSGSVTAKQIGIELGAVVAQNDRLCVIDIKCIGGFLPRKRRGDDEQDAPPPNSLICLFTHSLPNNSGLFQRV
jgi:hypothetical protein